MNPEIMLLIVLSMVGSAALWFGGIMDERGERGFPFLASTSIALILLVPAIGVVGPRALGVGHVSSTIDNLEKRLTAGAAYRLCASTRDGGQLILLVNNIGTNEFLAIRSAGPATPPEYFTLVDGKPVAIPPPDPK
ncbi:MAG: hypothetical protein KGH56_01800 [Patescibacteria group bacterium]|nr:hypothetical protein [Patescibacteria group bacterium]